MPAPHRELVARIQTIVSQRPEEIRAQVVEAIRGVIPSHFGMFFKCASGPTGQLYFAGLVTNGDREVDERVSPFDDAPVIECPWMPPHSNPEAINRFIRIRSFYPASYQSSFEVEQLIWQPLETGDQLRAVICDGLTLLGWIGIVRRGLRNRFTADEERTLQVSFGSIKAALAAAEALESEGRQGQLFAVLRPDGRLEHASEAFRHWCDGDRIEQLHRRVRALDTSSTQIDALVGGALPRLVRLDGPAGVRYLATLDRAERLRFDAGSWLTSRQREIAELAAAGATVGEIATGVGVSSNTVKAHLKVIYARLGVGNRIELARQLQIE